MSFSVAICITVSLFPHLHNSFSPVSVDVKHYVYLLNVLFTVCPYYVNATSDDVKFHMAIIIIFF